MFQVPPHKQADPAKAPGQFRNDVPSSIAYKPVHGGYPTPLPETDHNGRFLVAVVNNPPGYRAGRYYYVMHAATGRKVSRYLRRIGSADHKAMKYARWYAQGDHHWPEVDRWDELNTNPDAVPTLSERFMVALGLGVPALL